MEKKKNICPRCGMPGSGPHGRWAKKPQFRYYYFAHKSKGKIKWCYLGRSSHSTDLISLTGSFTLEKLMDLTLLTDQELAIIDRTWSNTPSLSGRQNPEFSEYFTEMMEKEKLRRLTHLSHDSCSALTK